MEAQQVTFVGKDQVAVQPVEVAPPGAKQVLLHATATVVSPGTELAHLHGVTDFGFPSATGYCFCGRVAARGAEARQFAEGELVAAMGTHTSQVVVDEAMCFSVPARVTPEEAAAFSLVAIVLQGVRKGEVSLGCGVAVVGLGAIGNLAGQLARAAGASVVVGIDPVEWRRHLAMSCGFDAAVISPDAVPSGDYPRLRRSGGFDVVIEATGVPEPINAAFKLARRLGRVVLLGSTRGSTQQVDFYHDVHRKGLTVLGAHNSARPSNDDIGGMFTLGSDLQAALDLMASGRLNISSLIHGSVPYTQAPKAYRRLMERTEPLITLALDWSTAPR